MDITITMTAFRRPAYTRQVLEALALCRGVENCRLLANVEPGHDDVIAAMRSFDACETDVVVNPKRLKLNRNTFTVLSRARKCKAILHLEDDTVPTLDALEFFHWGLTEFGSHPRVLSISGHNILREKKKPKTDVASQCRFRRKFTCWGWAITGAKLNEVLGKWCFRNPKSFARKINYQTRGRRFELHPRVSRIQNIGFEQSENSHRGEKWRRRHQHAPWVADDHTEGYTLWKVPREMRS